MEQTFVRCRLFVLAVYALIALPSPARADTAAEARKAIQAAYDKQSAATVYKDVEGAIANNALNYTYRNPKGKTQTLAHLKQTIKEVFSFPVLQSLENSIVIQRFVLKGYQAAVTIKEHTKFFYTGPNGENKVFVGVTISKDMWTKQGNGWKRIFSNITSEKDTVDGQPTS